MAAGLTLVLVGVACGGDDARGPAPGVGSGALVQTPGEALDQDLGLAPEAAGWTIEQSRAQHLAAEAVSKVAQELAATRPDIFVGSDLADEPGAPLKLYIKGPADAAVRALVEAAGSPIEVVDRQPFSFTELEERSRAVHDHLMRLGFDNLSTGFRIEGRGEIDAAVTARPGLPRDADEIAETFPAHLRGSVRLRVSTDPVAVPE